jgi:hypothetical protein
MMKAPRLVFDQRDYEIASAKNVFLNEQDCFVASQ